MLSLKHLNKESLFLMKKEKGYRYSLDPFLIADFVESKESRYAADLGTGNGIIPVLLARKFPLLKFIGLEIQWSLVCEAKKNVMKNKLSDRIRIVCCDIKNIGNMIKYGNGKMDLVVGNPPYRRGNDGRINQDREKAIARHEIKITLAQYITACGHLVRDMGKVAIIYHPYRLPELLNAMKKVRIIPKRMRFVHSRAGTEASMILLEGVKNGKNDLTVLNPLFIYDANNNYSEEMTEIYTKAGINTK